MVNGMGAMQDQMIDVTNGKTIIRELSLGGISTNYLDTIDSDTRTNHWVVDAPLTAYVSDTQAPAHNITPVVKLRVGHSYIRHTAKHCKFHDTTDCWYLRVHPLIEEISDSVG